MSVSCADHLIDVGVGAVSKIICRGLGGPAVADPIVALAYLAMVERLPQTGAENLDARQSDLDVVLADGLAVVRKFLGDTTKCTQIGSLKQRRPFGSRTRNVQDLAFAFSFVRLLRIDGAEHLDRTHMARLRSLIGNIERWQSAGERHGAPMSFDDFPLPRKARGVNFDRIWPLVEEEWFRTDPHVYSIQLHIRRELTNHYHRTELARQLMTRAY